MPLVTTYLVSLKRSVLPLESKGSTAGSVFAALIFASASVVLFLHPSVVLGGALEVHDRMVVTAACYTLLWVAGAFLFLRTGLMRRLAFPFAMLVFMVPLPTVVVSGMEVFLMRASAEVAQWLFQWTGTPVHRNGQLIELPGMVLEVSRGCSGIRSTLVLLITSLIASYMFLSSSLHRGLLTALVIPLGILRNALRILVIGLLCVHVRPEMIDSWIHRHGGPLFFSVSLMPLLAMAAWFRHREGKRIVDDPLGEITAHDNTDPHPARNPEKDVIS
jgi:exosortase